MGGSNKEIELKFFGYLFTTIFDALNHFAEKPKSKTQYTARDQITGQSEVAACL